MKRKISLAVLAVIVSASAVLASKAIDGPYTIVGQGAGFTEAQAASACPGAGALCAYLTADPNNTSAYFFFN